MTFSKYTVFTVSIALESSRRQKTSLSFWILLCYTSIWRNNIKLFRLTVMG